MAQVTVRVKIDQTFTYTIEAIDKDEAIDAICDLKRAKEQFLNACIDEFTIEDAEYDEPDED